MPSALGECVHIVLSSIDDDMFFEASICLAIHLHKSWWPRIYMEMNGVSGIYFGSLFSLTSEAFHFKDMLDSQWH
ncbi:Phosphoribosylformylglycinamidine cyclo-ligase, partial [Bienertia sinuspersici]